MALAARRGVALSLAPLGGIMNEKKLQQKLHIAEVMTSFPDNGRLREESKRELGREVHGSAARMLMFHSDLPRITIFRLCDFKGGNFLPFFTQRMPRFAECGSSNSDVTSASGYASSDGKHALNPLQ